MTNKNAELADLLPKRRESENPEEYVRLAVAWERSFKEGYSGEGNPFRN